jgi:hypothetical protein
MNKSSYQPMPVLLRAEPSDLRPTSGSAKILRVIAAFGTVLALCGVIAICLVAFNAFPPATQKSKAAADLPIVPTVKPSSAAEVSQNNGADAAALTDPNQASAGTVSEDHTQVPSVALVNPTPAPAAVPLQSDSDLLKTDRPVAAPVSVDRHLSESVRRKLEKARRQAEEQRVSLEDDYEHHAISTASYKKGEEKYRRAIEKYRKAMNAGAEPKN